MTDTVSFRAADLCSKWGFGDGDMLSDVLEGGGFGYDALETENLFRLPEGVSHLNFEHEVLARAVEQHVLPQCKLKITTVRLGCIHNPFRAETVGEFPVDTYQERLIGCPHPPEVLLPAVVKVPVSWILAIAAELKAEILAVRGAT